MLGAAPTQAKLEPDRRLAPVRALRSSACTPSSTSSRVQAPVRRAGLLTRLLPLMCVAAALFAGFAGATPRAPSDAWTLNPGSVWAVEVVPGPTGSFDRATLRTLKADGVNAIVLDVERLGSSTAAIRTVDAVRQFAASV